MASGLAALEQPPGRDAILNPAGIETSELSNREAQASSVWLRRAAGL